MKTSRRSISFKPDSKMQFGELNLTVPFLFQSVTFLPIARYSPKAAILE